MESTSTSVEIIKNDSTTATAVSVDTSEVIAANKVVELQSQIDRLRLEAASATAAHEQEVSDLRIAKVVAESATKKTPPTTAAQQVIARDKAIEAVGGLARWNMLTPSQRCSTFGIDASEATAKEVAEVFGPKSSSVKAAQLMRTDPARYRRLKGIARELGIL